MLKSQFAYLSTKKLPTITKHISYIADNLEYVSGFSAKQLRRTLFTALKMTDDLFLKTQ